jgi:hypothetical protein
MDDLSPAFAAESLTVNIIEELVTITSDLSLQQAKADHISSFCAFSGMAISIPKIEAIYIQHPDATLLPPQTLILRDWKWDPTPVTLSKASPNESTKYLGARVTFGHLEKRSFQWCKDHIRTTTSILKMKRATGQCKQKVISVQLILQILYHTHTKKGVKTENNCSRYYKKHTTFT